LVWPEFFSVSNTIPPTTLLGLFSSVEILLLPDNYSASALSHCQADYHQTQLSSASLCKVCTPTNMMHVSDAPVGTVRGTQLYPIVTLCQVICSAAKAFAASTSRCAQFATSDASSAFSRPTPPLSRLQLQQSRLFQTWKQFRLQVCDALLPDFSASAALRHSFT
jgi:hypothetical protein